MSEKTVTLTKDGGIVVAPTQDSDEGGSIRIPQAPTSLGAGFGDSITADDLLYAATREPVAGFLIYGVAADVVEKWFIVNNLKTEGADPEFDAAIQAPLQKLKAKTALRQLIEFERLYGKALLVCSFSDVSAVPDLLTPRQKGAEPLMFVAYPRRQYQVTTYDTDPTSLRFGLPLTYTINAWNQDATMNTNFTVHWTRCFEAQTRTNGQSILTLCWDDLTCGRNIRWGVSQWIFRTGGGFAVIKFPKEIGGVATTPEKLRQWAAAKEWSDITHQTYICILNEVMDFKFEGAQGATLNPEPFFDTNTKQIAKATGIPKSILEGAEAGALTGSEKNDQQYYKKISGIQSSFEDAARWMIDMCMDGGLVQGIKTAADAAEPAGSVLKCMLRKVFVHDKQDQAPVDYAIEWNSAFELNELDEARTDLINEQANQVRLTYQTVDEVRKLNNLSELPLGEGASLKASGQSSLFGQQSNFVANSADQVTGGMSSPPLQANYSFVATLKDYAKKVMKGEITKEKAFSEGAVIIENYNRFEAQQAQIWVQNHTGTGGAITLSPEMMGELDSQKKRFLADYSGSWMMRSAWLRRRPNHERERR